MAVKIAVKITPEKLAESGTEHGHQAAFFCWAALPEIRQVYPVLRFMFAIPNGGLRHPATAGRLKAEGVKAGVPDILLPVTRVRWAGLFMEMKKKKGGRVQAEQTEYHEFLTGQHYCVTVCYEWTTAVETVTSYLNTGELMSR